MHNVDFFKDNLPIFIPLIILEIVLVIIAIRDILKSSSFRFGNKIVWLIFVIVIQIIGPVIYFVFARRNDE